VEDFDEAEDDADEHVVTSCFVLKDYVILALGGRFRRRTVDEFGFVLIFSRADVFSCA
jgi:hypothetical protein